MQDGTSLSGMKHEIINRPKVFSYYNDSMTKSEARNQKRKEVVEAVILRNEPATLIPRVYNQDPQKIKGYLDHFGEK